MTRIEELKHLIFLEDHEPRRWPGKTRVQARTYMRRWSRTRNLESAAEKHERQNARREKYLYETGRLPIDTLGTEA